MKPAISFVSIIMVAAVLVVACSSGGDSNSGSYYNTAAPAGPAVITTSVQGSQAASAVAQSRELVLTSTLLFKNLGDIGLSQMTPAVSATVVSVNCTDGGTYTYTGSYVAPRYTMDFDFSGCRERGFQYVGMYKLSGTLGAFTITLGSPGSSFNIFNFDANYTVLLAYLKANNSFTMTSGGVLPNTSGTITSTGAITTFDYFLLNTYDMTFSRLAAVYSQTSDISLNETTSITVNGSFGETWSNRVDSMGVKFTDFKVVRVRNSASATAPANFTSEDVSADGQITLTFRPRTFGYPGIFNVVTTTPFHYVYAPSKHATAGTLEINGAATEQINAGSDLTITVVGDTTILPYTQEYTLMQVSDFAAFEQDKPPLLGATSTSPITGASTMAVTLTWTGPAYTSKSDMDLHLMYYNVQAPVTTTPITWHLFYGSRRTYPGAATGSVCTDPVGITYYSGFDLNGTHTGTCNVGLDFDDRDGYGPEHITALQIPPGYYIVAVHSFALPPAESGTLLYLSLHLGDNIFGPFQSPPIKSTGDWYRVADVRVNLDGSIDVLAPDTTLPPP